MKVLIQRVTEASVAVNGEMVGQIGQGLLALLGVERDDDKVVADRMVDKLLAYRVFPDQQGKMNLSVADVGGEVLLVSQFTLAAETRKGLRPSFTPAAEPAVAETLYEYMIERIRQRSISVATGQFAADMKVSLIHDGPVTFMLDV